MNTNNRNINNHSTRNKDLSHVLGMGILGAGMVVGSLVLAASITMEKPQPNATQAEIHAANSKTEHMFHADLDAITTAFPAFTQGQQAEERTIVYEDGKTIAVQTSKTGNRLTEKDVNVNIQETKHWLVPDTAHLGKTYIFFKPQASAPFCYKTDYLDVAPDTARTYFDADNSRIIGDHPKDFYAMQVFNPTNGENIYKQFLVITADSVIDHLTPQHPEVYRASDGEMNVARSILRSEVTPAYQKYLDAFESKTAAKIKAAK